MNSQTRFKDFVERFAKSYNITPEEAMKHTIVKEVKLYYEEEEDISK